jgi:hypothetical protein
MFTANEMIGLAEGLLGEGCVRLVDYGAPFAAGLMQFDCGFAILIDESQPPDEYAFTIAHELGHWLRYGTRHDTEARANGVGHALVAGDLAYLRRLARYTVHRERAGRLIGMVEEMLAHSQAVA